MNHIASPDTSDAGIERLIQAKGKTAARVTPADIEANIASEHYFTAADGYRSAPCFDPNGQPADCLPPPAPLELLTFCVLVLRNGFTVTGESACASPENFDADIGRRIARENAVQKIWPLMGYELRSKLAAKPQPVEYSWSDVKDYLTQNTIDGFIKFKVTMKDGGVFTGEVLEDSADTVRDLIIHHCNKAVFK